MLAPPAAEHRRQVPVHLVDHRLGEEPARDARLVRDHHDRQPGAIQRADRVDGPRVEPTRSARSRYPTSSMMRAVAIEKHRAPGRAPVLFIGIGHNIRRAAPSTRSTPIPRMHA